MDATRPTSDVLARSVEAKIRSRALAGLYAAGGSLVLVTVLLPHPDDASIPALIAISGVAYLVALALWVRDQIPTSVLALTLALGTTLITGVAHFSALSPSPMIFFYLWVFLYAAYFFDTRTTALEIGFAAFCLGLLLVVRPPDSAAAAWWLVPVGTLLVAAMLIRAMRNRLETLIERLYDTARTDPLTGLTNRRGFREHLDLELERARRSRGSLAVLVGDLDRFKEVNDRAGHQVGDAVLVRVAGLLESRRRPYDLVARVGGEEFTLILPDCEAAEAYTVAERLRETIALELAQESVPVTISFGVAASPEHAQTASSLLRMGDDALYSAKRLGRDRTVIHTPGVSEEAGSPARNVEEERYVSSMLDLAEAVDLRFSGSARHSETVARYAEMIAVELGLGEGRVARVRLAGALHDIGKLLIPDRILQKPGALDEDEFEQIKKHPEIAGQILEHPGLSDVRAWVEAHHERPDGRGYPRGVGGSDLGLEPRILAVADAFEAMTSDRSYNTAMGPRAALEELLRCSGAQFDRAVVEGLVRAVDREEFKASQTLAG